jgi:hypothetical protein
MGAMRRDHSTVLLGALTMASGVGLWLWADRLRAGAKKPSAPSRLAKAST